MFSSGTHYIIKNRDIDDFNISSVTAASSYLYAHGDMRTCQRLRTHIQQGHQIVMLYNSGGISQLFSWHARRRPCPRTSPGRASACSGCNRESVSEGTYTVTPRPCGNLIHASKNKDVLICAERAQQ